MGILCEKISGLFKFGAGAEIMLYFIDEDGESVAIVDDEDLGEMLKQKPPLRIDVKLPRFFLPPNHMETYTDCFGTTHQPHLLIDDSVTEVDFSIKAHRPKLDNLFVRSFLASSSPSITIYREGNIIVPPSSTLTNTWTVKNTGTIVWPQKTRLVWIEVYKLTNLLSVELKIPAIGLSVGQELDITVDFTSPDLTGPYISYWRMMSPCGVKFGERLWVLVQVTRPIRTMFYRSGASTPAPSYHYPLVEFLFLQLQTEAAKVFMTR